MVNWAYYCLVQEDGNDSKSVENSMVFEGDIVTNTDEIAESYGPGMFDDDNIVS